MINYQGRLTDTSGNPINGSVNLFFSIYDAPAGGTLLWPTPTQGQEQQNIGFVNGVFSAQIGSVIALSSAVFVSSSAYLDVAVGINTNHENIRQHLVSNPYAFASGTTQSVPAEIVVSTIDAAATTPYHGVNVTTSVFVQGNVGIGTTNPTNPLTVSGNANVTGTLTLGTPLAVGSGGTGTTAPGLVAGTNIAITGTWPDQTIAVAAGSALPTGMVSFFNLSACPSGWSALVAAEGRYLVGLQPSGTLAWTDGTALSNQEDRPTGQHSHTITDPGHSHGVYIYTGATGSYKGVGTSSLALGNGGTFPTAASSTGISVNSTGTTLGTNAPYLQLLACSKN